MSGVQRVLLIEDSITQAIKMIAYITHLVGWKVDHVVSLADARAKADESGPYNLVVVDLTLPDAHDLEAVEFVRARMPESVCVVVTGEEQIDTAKSALRIGASDYITKREFNESTVSRALQLAMLRRELIEQTKASERKLSSVLSAMHDALFVVDLDGTVKFSNAKAERLLVRFRDDDTVGVRLHATPQMQEQTVVQDRAGSQVPVEVQTTELMWGEAPAHLVVLRDLSTQRSMEALQVEMKNVEELAQVGEEAYGDWHDLKNRIQGMEGLIGEVEDELRGGAAPALSAIRKLLGEMAETARRYHRGAVKRRNVRETLDLSALVEARCAMFRVTCGDDAVISLRIARVPPVLGDQLELGGAVDNLLTNALKAIRRRSGVSAGSSAGSSARSARSDDSSAG